MARPSKYFPELRERAVRMVFIITPPAEYEARYYAQAPAA